MIQTITLNFNGLSCEVIFVLHKCGYISLAVNIINLLAKEIHRCLRNMEQNFQTPSKFRRRESLTQKLLTIPPTPFLEKLGYGTGVNVWKLQPSPRNKGSQSPWAIKNVRSNINKSLTNKFQSLLNKEASILKNLDHENIIGFRGYLNSSDGRKCLAMEVGGESLGNLIEARLESDLGPYPAHLILQVALSIAKALNYLHEDKKILHGDLKSFNIVVKNDFHEIKLCDFGVSLSLEDQKIKEKYVGTPIYSAPECQEGALGPVTAKSDIFSLGLVLWEMIALCPPHTEDLLAEDFSENDSNSDLENSCLSNMEQNYGTRPALPPVDLGFEYAPVIGIFYACTEQDPEERPSARDLIEWLEDLNKS